MHYHEDDRAQRFMDIFPKVNGQIMMSRIRTPGHIVAWHKHKIQTDYWFCVQGSFKVGLVTQEDFQNATKIDNALVTFVYISDKNHNVLTILPETYHGYMALEPNSIMLYYMDQQYDPDDEYRAKVGIFGEDWSIPNK